MKSSQNDRLAIELAEDEYEINRTQDALIHQAQAVQEALVSLKADIERTQGMIAPTVEKVLNETLKPLVGSQPIIPPTGGATNIFDMVPDILKMLGIGGPSNVNTEL